MSTKPKTRAVTTSWRMTPDDQKIVRLLVKRNGENLTQLLRRAIRNLARQEGVAA